MDKEVKSVQARQKIIRDKARESGNVTDALDDHFYIQFGFPYPPDWYKS